MKSWKTTLAAVGVFVSALAGFVSGQIDANQLWVAGLAVASAFGLLSARDNDVTSEQAGAK